MGQVVTLLLDDVSALSTAASCIRHDGPDTVTGIMLSIIWKQQLPAAWHSAGPHHGSRRGVEDKVPEGAEVGEHLLEEVPLQPDVGRQVRHLHWSYHNLASRIPHSDYISCRLKLDQLLANMLAGTATGWEQPHRQHQAIQFLGPVQLYAK